MTTPSSSRDVTRLLDALNDGRTDVMPALLPLVYDELRRLASSYLRRERGDHTLQPTALVHEAYLKLVDQRVDRRQNRSHFLGIAAQAMRRIMVDHARAHAATKRGAGLERVTLGEGAALGQPPGVDVIALDAALTRLAAVDARQARVVELRFFAGLDVDETARVLDLSPITIKRDWAMARDWLQRELAPLGPPNAAIKLMHPQRDADTIRADAKSSATAAAGINASDATGRSSPRASSAWIHGKSWLRAGSCS